MRSLAVLTELYRRHVWRDARTVNVIGARPRGLASRHYVCVVRSGRQHTGYGCSSDGAVHL